MKDFLERGHGLIGQQMFRLDKESGHFALPAVIDFAMGHGCARALKAFRFEITDQQTIGPQEERIVVPAGFPEGLLHFRPHRTVTFFVVLKAFRLDLQNKTDSLHD